MNLNHQLKLWYMTCVGDFSIIVCWNQWLLSLSVGWRSAVVVHMWLVDDLENVTPLAWGLAPLLGACCSQWTDSGQIKTDVRQSGLRYGSTPGDLGDPVLFQPRERAPGWLWPARPPPSPPHVSFYNNVIAWLWACAIVWNSLSVVTYSSTRQEVICLSMQTQQ